MFGGKRARKEVEKNLARMKFKELQEKSELHRELLYRECLHMVKTYMELCEKDKTYNTTLCGIIPISEKSAKNKLQMIYIRLQLHFQRKLICSRNWKSSQGQQEKLTRIIFREKADYKNYWRHT